MTAKRYEIKVTDLHDKFQKVERTVIVDGVWSEYAAELHALATLKGLRTNRELGSPYVPNGKIKVKSVKEVKGIAEKEFKGEYAYWNEEE